VELIRTSFQLAGFPIEKLGLCNQLKSLEMTMAWNKPEFTDMRFGFEVTMYILNR